MGAGFAGAFAAARRSSMIFIFRATDACLLFRFRSFDFGRCSFT